MRRCFFAALSARILSRRSERLVEIGLSYIPADCAVAARSATASISPAAAFQKETAREYMMQHYIGHIEWHYMSPEDEKKGYGEGPFGFDVPSNMFIIAYNLIAGRGDLEKSMCDAVWFGEDTDCTAGTIAALHGIRCGIDSIDQKWIEPIGHEDQDDQHRPVPHGEPHPEGHLRVLRAYRKAPCRRRRAEIPARRACEGLHGPAWFTDIYDDMRVVTYRFDYINVRLDYMGDPVIRAGEPKRIRF